MYSGLFYVHRSTAWQATTKTYLTTEGTKEHEEEIRRRKTALAKNATVAKIQRQ